VRVELHRLNFPTASVELPRRAGKGEVNVTNRIVNRSRYSQSAPTRAGVRPFGHPWPRPSLYMGNGGLEPPAYGSGGRRSIQLS
jgi:hypothetical protein